MDDHRLSVLALERISLPRESLGHGFSRSAAIFFDYVIDGVALRPVLGTPDIGVLSDDRSSGWFALRLLGDEPEPCLGGRAVLYGCRQCLDVDCGGLAVTITRRGDRIRWDRIERFSVDYERCGFNFEYPLGGGYEFAFAQYRAVLAPFLPA